MITLIYMCFISSMLGPSFVLLTLHVSYSAVGIWEKLPEIINFNDLGCWAINSGLEMYGITNSQFVCSWFEKKLLIRSWKTWNHPPCDLCVLILEGLHLPAWGFLVIKRHLFTSKTCCAGTADHIGISFTLYYFNIGLCGLSGSFFWFWNVTLCDNELLLGVSHF